MKMLNVMHIRDSSGIFGAERVILTLGKHINRELFNFKLLCMRRQDGRSERLISKAKQIGIQVVPVDVKGRMDFNAVFNIRKAFKENFVTVFHSHDFKSNFYGLIASMNLGIKKVATAHGSTRDSFLQQFYLYWDEKVTYKFFDRIIAVSEDLRTRMEKKNDESMKRRIKVIQNGLDFGLLENDLSETESEEPLNLPERNRIFAVIGRLYPDKGHRFFLEAFSNVYRYFPYTTGLIVGDGPIPVKGMINEQIKRLNLEESVFLCGVRSDMNFIYASIDFLVIPSLTEGIPYVLLEAMASKIPVLATAVGDIPLIIDNGVNGYLVPPGDAGALKKRMIDLLKYPEKAEEMAERGHRFVIENFSAERMVRDTEKLYVSLVN